MRTALLRFGASLVLLAVTAWTALPVMAETPAPAVAALPALKPPFDPNLAAKWRLGDGGINWPSDNGFAAPPILMVLPAGMQIDRFGSEYGNFFSPRGSGFGKRALPYVCGDAALPYHVYEIEKPLLAWTGAAAAWFGQNGGGTQIMTDANVAALLAGGTLTAVNDPGPAPCPPPSS